MSDQYRFDRRSKKQFKKDIKDATKIENDILALWLDQIEAQTGARPTFKDGRSGGRDGEFLEDKDVNNEADYEVEGYGRVEVKFAKPLCERYFHLKVDQVIPYLKQQASILMVNGWETDDPVYTLITSEVLTRLIPTLEQVRWGGFGGKQSYRLPVEKFIWRPLLDD